MAVHKRLFLFGDQTVETYHSIKELARHSRRSPSLASFFRKSNDAVNDVISSLHTSQRARFFSFGSILGLAEAYLDSGVNDVILSTVLLCFAQLGFLIMYEFPAIPLFLLSFQIPKEAKLPIADKTSVLVVRNMMPVFSMLLLMTKCTCWDYVRDYCPRRQRQRQGLRVSCWSSDRKY